MVNDSEGYIKLLINNADEMNKYLAVFENLNMPIILLDENNIIINFNLSASKLFIDIHVAELLFYSKDNPINSLKIINEKLTELINSSEEQLSFETYLETQKGKRYFQVILKRISDNFQSRRYTIVMLNDLTDRREAELNLQIAKAKAEEADRQKTAFMANMSHEIRTPMNAILGFTELILANDPNPKDRTEFLKHIRKSSLNLLNIIEDIIDVAKIESNQLKLRYKICKPYEVIEDLYVVFKETLRNYGIDKEVELIIDVREKDKNISFYSDTERLRQVLSNLLSNAAKFTNRGFIEFGYKLVNTGFLFFFVRDSGPGISEEMKDKIFERFTQIEGNSSMHHRGAGLGLSICKNLVGLLGGNIWVDSIPGKGSDFCFQLPFREIPEEIKNTSPVKLNEKTTNSFLWNDKCILIAEDDEDNFLYLNELLKPTRARIVRARNGLEAINISETLEKLDVILMDIKLPEIDGIEATKYIVSIRPGLPVIAQTAFAMESDQIKCLKAGCCAYITKPVEKQQLLLLIEKYLSNKSSMIHESHLTN